VNEAGENELWDYFARTDARAIRKYHHYFDIYDRHLRKFRNRAPVVVEIGVRHGGSLDMWRHYFGADATIHGIDLDWRCKRLEAPGIHIHTGDQADRQFWTGFKAEVPVAHVVIDDGGHHMKQQLMSFHEMFPHMAEGGVYICEDVETSYWREFGGGYRKPDSFVEYAKRLVDSMNAWHSKDANSFVPDQMTTILAGLHFYANIVVLERGNVEMPQQSERGRIRLEDAPES